MKRTILALCLCLGLAAPALAYTPDQDYLRDRQALDTLQRDAFRLAWDEAEPHSGMVYEATFSDWEVLPVTTGGTGFAVAAIVTAVDRGWISRDQALERLLRITRFLRDDTDRASLHGAFPHWLNGATGETIKFSERDTGADIVETSLLMQGLLIARAYFNGPGAEETLRRTITRLWEDVDWNWFTGGEGKGLYWHWSPELGFMVSDLKILGYNECLITYILAASSPTHPISRRAYDYWPSGKHYQPHDLFGYRVEATAGDGGGPLFLAHYSFIGLDPRHMADSYVPGGYFARNIAQTMSNRAYCLYIAPPENLYSPSHWGLTASQTPDGYAVSRPGEDHATVAPTAAISSMPYTPHYSLEVLRTLLAPPFRERIWGKNGPYDAFSAKNDWVSDIYIAIDQLPMIGMVENYRTGLLWRLFMSDRDVQAGLRLADISEPQLAPGFPEAIVALAPKRAESAEASETPAASPAAASVSDPAVNAPGAYERDAYDARRHPDTGLFHIPCWLDEAGPLSFTLTAGGDSRILYSADTFALKGRNILAFPQFMPPDDRVLTLTLRAGDRQYALPVRLH